MSCQSLQTSQFDPVARVIPRRPLSRRAAPRAEEATDAAANLFADVFDTGVIALPSAVDRARNRARRVVEAALDRAEAQALPHLANFWTEEAALESPAARAANRPDPVPDLDTLALRKVLCAKPDLAPDAPATKAERDRLRLAVHAMNTTLTIAYPPVGAVVMTYSFLRGESMRLTARSLVLVAGLMALMHGQIPGV